MNTQIISEETRNLDNLETEFMNAEGYIRGLADTFFHMSMSCDTDLRNLDQNSINSLMYQCIQQSDKCDEILQDC